MSEQLHTAQTAGEQLGIPREALAYQSCSVADCDRPAAKRLYCELHYHRWKVSGDPLTRTIIRDGHLSALPEYRVWTGMKTRCYNKNEKLYEYYGGRGIKISPRWLGTYGFVNFLADMGSRPTSHHSIDRVNTNGDYEPSNCEWVTSTIQNRNKRTPRNNKSGYKGVFQLKKSGRWKVSITVDRKIVHLRSYLTFDEAYRVRRAAEAKYWGSTIEKDIPDLDTLL